MKASEREKKGSKTRPAGGSEGRGRRFSPPPFCHSLFSFDRTDMRPNMDWNLRVEL